MQLLKLTGDSFTTYTPTKLEGHAQGQQTRASPFSLPMWESISTIFSMLLGSMSGEVILFSTARQTPSEVWIPMAVEPSCKQAQLQRRTQRRVATTEHQHHGAMLIPLYATCRDIVLGPDTSSRQKTSVQNCLALHTKLEVLQLELGSWKGKARATSC